MAEQTIVMTGASRGIGATAARRVLAENPDAHLVVLARPRARGALQTRESSTERISTIDADLLSLTSVRQAAVEVTGRIRRGALPPLGVLGLNAGAQYVTATRDSMDGYEATFAVNVLANHLLLRSFHASGATGVHAVVTVSDTHFGDLRHNLGMVPAPQWMYPQVLACPGAFENPLSPRAGRMAYSTSKLAAIYLVHAWARRCAESWSIQSFNPGFVPSTGLGRDAGPAARFALRYVLPVLTLSPLATTQQRAGQLFKNALVGDVSGPSGAYIDRDHITSSSAESYDVGREDELWEVMESLTAPFLAEDSDL